MKKKFLLFFSCIILASCQNTTSPALTDPDKKENTTTKLPQKTVEAEISPLDKKVYNSGKVETVPKFPGGIEKLYIFLKKNYVIPEDIMEDDAISPVIIATFIIEKDGKMSDIKIVRDFGYGSGSELVRVLKLLPHWRPAVKQGQAVRCLYSIPYYCKVK